MERIEDIGFGGLKLIQESESFCYGIDAVILADFAYRTCSSFRTAVDLGTGNGIIPFILSSKNESAHFIGVELQEEAVELAKRSCSLNDLGSEDRIRAVGRCGAYAENRRESRDRYRNVQSSVFS